MRVEFMTDEELVAELRKPQSSGAQQTALNQRAADCIEEHAKLYRRMASRLEAVLATNERLVVDLRAAQGAGASDGL